MPTFARMRERIITKACGLVAEIGFGSGLNLPHYDPAKVSRLIGIEPDPSMLGIARKRLAEFRMTIEAPEGKFEFVIGEDDRFTMLLKDVYGDRVHMPFGYISGGGVRIKLF